MLRNRHRLDPDFLRYCAHHRHTVGLLGLLLILGSIGSPTAMAQSIRSDGSTGTVVTRQGDRSDITGGRLSRDGANLFHSFEQFGLNRSEIANFISNQQIENILARVTGGDASVINGLLRVTGSDANLYLINPAGILFGRDARLDIPGSFTATTATGLGLGDGWLDAIATNDYDNLVGTPHTFAFATLQPGAIVNAGDLAVSTGQNLTLLGGTVVNTGTLAATDGQVTVAAVPGASTVRLSQTGMLLSLDIQPLVSPSSDLYPTPQSLPMLLTGGDGAHATGLTVNPDGSVQLTGSGVPVVAGDVVIEGAIAHTLVAHASHDLSLIESDVQTTGDAQLLAGNILRVRDRVEHPLQLDIGGQAMLQGNRGIDIFALSHPSSLIAAGGDLTLRSDGDIIGDGHFLTGGDYRIQRLDGTAGNLLSPNDPIILALGDVVLNNYTGASLHILAGGSVTLGTVSITGTGNQTNTINPANPNNLNGTTGLDDLANITRADGSPLLGYRFDPVLASKIRTTPLVINGDTNQTLDVRAGIDWASLGGLGADFTDGATPDSTSPASGASITVGSISFANAFTPNTVLLTNQYHPNSVTSGAIQITNDITAAANVETLFIDSRQSISTGNIDVSNGPLELFAVGDITAGALTGIEVVDDGSVVLVSTAGNIRVTGIQSGNGGVDVSAAGLFQVTGVIENLSNVNFDLFEVPRVYFDTPENAAVKQFLTDQGFLNADGTINDVVNETANDKTRFIRVDGNGDRYVLQDIEGFPASILVTGSDFGRVRIQHGGVSVPSPNPNITITGTGTTQFVVGPTVTTVPPASFSISQVADTFGDPELFRLLRHQSFSALTFGSATQFPTNVSGVVGGIVVGVGQNAVLQASLQNVPFVPDLPIDPGGGGGTPGGGGGNPGGGGGNPGGGGGTPGGDGDPDGEVASVSDQDFIEQTAELCPSSGGASLVALRGEPVLVIDESIQTGGTRSSGSAAIADPCATGTPSAPSTPASDRTPQSQRLDQTTPEAAGETAEEAAGEESVLRSETQAPQATRLSWRSQSTKGVKVR